jgi:hypothetical protein
MSVAQALPTDEEYVEYGRGRFQTIGRAFAWGDGDPRVERVRKNFRDDHTYRGTGRLTAKQRDILGVLRSAGDPLTLRDLFFIFDGVERTWIDHSAGSLGMAIKPLEAAGLVQRFPHPDYGKGHTSAKFLFTVPEWLPSRERVTPIRAPRQLEGVGRKTGAAYDWKAPLRREAHVCQSCDSAFHALGKPRACSEVCSWILDGVEPESPYHRAMLDLARAQKKERDKEREFGPSVPRRKGWMTSLDEPIRLRGVEREGATVQLHDVLPDTRSLDPLQILIGATEDRVREVVGDITVEDVERMSDDELAYLRRRILEAEIPTASVQQHERDRLRVPTPKRGIAPPPERTPMATKYKHRKPGHVASAGGKRSARKPRTARGGKHRGKVAPDVW